MSQSILGAIASMLAPPLCWACRAPVRAGAPLCLVCRSTLRPLGPRSAALTGVETWAPFAYEAAARDLVRALKYRGAAGVADAMAAQIVARAPPSFLAGAALVPVPLHPVRARQRGFDQAVLLARAVARRAGRPVATCLRRGGRPGAQVGRDRAGRLAGVAGNVWSSDRAPVHAVLVDDVATTGATLAACAAALRAAGAARVRAVTYARTLGR